MTILREGKHAGEFIVSEANVGGTGVARGRTTVPLASGKKVVAGQLISAGDIGNEVVPYIAGAPAIGISLDNYDATDGIVQIVMLNRDCEVNGAELTYLPLEEATAGTGVFVDPATSAEKATADAFLASLGIIVRPALDYI